MSDVVLFAGTTEGRMLAEACKVVPDQTASLFSGMAGMPGSCAGIHFSGTNCVFALSWMETGSCEGTRRKDGL